MDAIVERTSGAPSWDEHARLAALERYGVVDTEREQAFDEIAQLAAHIFDAPIAVVNFIGSDRQFFKAEIGIGQRELPLDVSICRHAILQPGLFVVPDLAEDPRFATNPLVNIDGGLRFYAGALLTSDDGLPLGTVCVLDTEPRPSGVTVRQGQALQTLASQTMAQLELRRASLELRQSEQRLRAFVTASSGMMYRMNADWTQLIENDGRGFVQSIARPNADWLRGFILPEDQPRVMATVTKAIANKSIFELEHRVRREDGTIGWTLSRAVPILDDNGEIVEWFGAASDVTERVAITERLRESEALARQQALEVAAIYDAAPVGLCEFDRNLRYIRINERLAEMNGVPAEEHIGRTVEEMVPDLSDQLRDMMQRVLAGEAVWGFDVVGETPKQPGVMRSWRENWLPRRNATGEIVGITVSVEEITEQRRADAALRESEARFRLLARVGQVGHFDWDPLSGQANISPEYQAIYGLQRTETTLGFERWLELVHPDDRAWVVDDMERARADPSATTVDHSHRIVRADTGEIRWIINRSEIRRDASGNVERVVGAQFDITDTKRAEERLRSAVVASPFPMMLHAEDGEVLEISRKWLELTGYRREELSTHFDWGRRAYPDRYERFEAAIAREFAILEEVDAGEWPVRTSDGQTLNWDFRIMPMSPLPDGRRLKLTAAVDVTERVAAARRQRLLMEELSHRAKNLLAIVQSLATQTFKGLAVDGPRRSFEGRLAALASAHNLLIKTNWEPAPLHELVSAALQPYATRADRFIVEGPTQLLEPKTAVSFALALHELATNAQKYGALSVPDGSVEVRWRLEDGRLKLVWRERDGPPVQQPTSRGFGSRMLERALATELSGHVTIEFDPRGVVCTVDAPAPAAVDRFSALTAGSA